MSFVTHDQRLPTESELLEWLKLKPRTYGWDAWMAVDRVTVNQSLQRDWVGRFGQHPLSRPLTGVAAVVDNASWDNFYAVRLGSPQVSFEESHVGSARVMVSMRAITGTQLCVDLPEGGAKRVTRIEHYTPLCGPKLAGQVLIDDPEGAANLARQVRIDLGTSAQTRFCNRHSLTAQQRAGRMFEQRFKVLPLDSRVCLISTLGRWDDGALVPETTRVRPFPAPDSQITGDGAVVVMTAMQGRDVGHLPDQEGDWKYPIPRGYNASLWLSNHCLATRAIEGGIRNVSTGAKFEYTNTGSPPGEVDTITATSGVMKPLGIAVPVPPFEKLNYELQPLLAGAPDGSAAFQITLAEGELIISWKMSTFGTAESPLVRTLGADGTSEVDCAWKMTNVYRYVNAGNRLQLELVGNSTKWVMPLYRQAGELNRLHYEHFSTISKALVEGLSLEADQVLGTMAGSEIDRLRLSGYVSAGHRAMRMDTVSLPSDLVMFGNMEVQPGAIELEPAEAVILAGTSLPLQATAAGLDWNVESAEGFEGDAGSISSNGIYTAPPLSSIRGGFTLVRVTASNETHHSTALISVMGRVIDANPLVFVASATTGPVRLSAGRVGGGDLEWALDSSAGATLEQPPANSDLLLDPGDRLYIPGPGHSEAHFSVDEVTVREPGGQALARISVLALGKNKQLAGGISIREGVELPPEQVQLDFVNGVPVIGAEWKVQVGSGTITQDGLFTMDLASEQPFAVITAQLTHEMFGTVANYVILPLPLVDLNTYRRAVE